MDWYAAVQELPDADPCIKGCRLQAYPLYRRTPLVSTACRLLVLLCSLIEFTCSQCLHNGTSGVDHVLIKAI